MQQSQRDKLIGIIKRAIRVNESLLDKEKALIQDISSDKDSELLERSNQNLSELSRIESLYLGVAKSLLEKINKGSKTQGRL